jgi:translation initiation factor IF-2
MTYHLQYFSIIYDLIDAVKFDLSGELEPEVKEEIIGIATVKDVFRSSKLGAIAGNYSFRRNNSKRPTYKSIT